ncbi:uncharacterized protein TNCV_1376921 [Trichonephila clavipes]|nr:uncharacterized protein TNCV_1376921 [Trichonephila clavipes]
MWAYTHQKAKSKYKDRLWLKRASQDQSNGRNKTPYDRAKQCRERKRMNAAERINNRTSTSAAGTVEIMQVDGEIASILTPDCIGIDFIVTMTSDDIRWNLKECMKKHDDYSETLLAIMPVLGKKAVLECSIKEGLVGSSHTFVGNVGNICN